MKHLAAFVFASLVVGFLPAGAAAQGIIVYKVILEQPAPGLPLTVGVDDGSGFSFATLSDDDGDGLIELPPVPVPSRLALRVTPDVSPDIGQIGGADLVWSIEEASAESINYPLLMLAEGIEGDLGIDFGGLTAPPREFTPGERFTVAGGVLPEWPGIRLVDASGVPDLETFVREVDTLPELNDEVLVSFTTAHFTLVPEPSTLLVSLVAFTLLLSLRRRNRSIN